MKEILKWPPTPDMFTYCQVEKDNIIGNTLFCSLASFPNKTIPI